MAWSAPRTWVTAEVVTASHMNTDVRDNFLETAPAKATAATGLIIADGLNSVVERTLSNNEVDVSETTASTTFADLATAGPAVTVGTGGTVVVLIGARTNNNTAGALSWMSIDISGATSLSPQEKWSLMFESSAADDSAQSSRHYLFTVTSGTNTFTAKYKVSAGTGSFDARQLTVIPAS